ncbi:zinc ribbon domain-containing protein [Paucibacter sp. R3-3]|uniref:Zinc ribbon domain-containing protein n=1 Tax=Roseateles agri TaxID=3098619 RepID=A0ABU5DJR2_9BURK|nr:zinc ribbon domain-containing protein [Paucibacter sp. R3-3]MDY0745968.1 zinc ribbon domain-containing protein [Paucibacter sp. R3-3]
MALENYRDLSSGSSDLNAGFQFEFYCCGCTRKWKTPFKPYRKGQLTGFLTRFGFLFSSASQASRMTSGMADYGMRDAKAQALEEAMPQAARMFTNCVSCGQGFCEDCLDGSDTCEKCLQQPRGHGHHHAGSASGAAQAGGQACPNCGTAGSGGRFCSECGFDMASTHKSCPGCGAMAERGARFCGDCGHGF